MHQNRPVEHGLRAITLVLTIRKPFDVIAEGLVSEKSRGDKTAIELLVAGVGGWEHRLRQRLSGGKHASD